MLHFNFATYCVCGIISAGAGREVIISSVGGEVVNVIGRQNRVILKVECFDFCALCRAETVDVDEIDNNGLNEHRGVGKGHVQK